MQRLGLTVLVFALPMVLGLVVAQRTHQDGLLHRSKTVATRSVFFLDNMVAFAEQANRDALPLLNLPCEQALPTLRRLAAFQPFLRSVNLVRNGDIVCSSIVGPTRRFVGESLGHRGLWLSSGNWIRPGVPILIVQADRGRDGVRTVIDAEAIGFMFRFTDPAVDTLLHVGDGWLDGHGVLRTSPADASNRASFEASSSRYPLSVRASVASSSSWMTLWKTHNRFFVVVLLLSLSLAGGLYWFLGRSRSLYAELARGLRAREFVPYLQPIMDRHGECVVGAEVLMRWQHPSGEVIRPDLFIPQAETCGLIGPMTVQLMEIVGEELERYHQRLPAGFHVGFNISAKHCKDDELLLECQRFLRRFPQGAIHLVLELTERELFMDDEHAHVLFQQLDALGVKLAIDDFGTGHSSLSYLQHFHVHCLKIDQSFVQLIGEETLADHIVENIIDLAKRLDLSLVAEGVETQEQAQNLAARGVDMMQGFLYGKPVPCSSFLLAHTQRCDVCHKADECFAWRPARDTSLTLLETMP